MSCEESYIAIRRYLTDEREPYAPGTHGNTKRKIRKAAACYVVRTGILYYQRRQKGQHEFTELEVVLQAGRRKELIDEAHITVGGEHLNQHQTWETISQKYWWRGILKQVKDYIRECTQCQSRQDRGRGSTEDGISQGFGGRPGRRRTIAVEVSDEDEDEDEPEDLDFVSPTQSKSKNPRGVDKHELVFVDSKGVVKQFLPKHGQSMLDKLNQQRLNNQFCDITLLIEGEEHRAHKAVLAACSDYFYELFIEKGAAASHEAVVDLSGFSKPSILPLLDFAYTSNLTFNFCVMAEVATLARHLLMAEVLEICESVHRLVEEKKLTVYQRGDIHTVVSTQTLPQQPLTGQPGTYMVTMQSDGQAVVTHTGDADAEQPLAVIAHPEGAEAGETLALLAQAEQVGAGESLTLIAPSEDSGAGETMTVITHSGQAGSGESLAVVQACWKVDEPQGDVSALPESMETGPFLISVDTGKEVSPEMVQVTAAAPPAKKEDSLADVQELPTEPDPAPPPPKRKRGRPAKVKPEPVPVVEPEEEVAPEPSPVALEEAQESSPDDPNRRRLRQRSMGKGGYVRLHMGLEQEEDEDEERKAPGTPRSSTVKATPRAVRRGPRAAQAAKKSDSEETAAAAAAMAAAASEDGPVSEGAEQTEDQTEAVPVTEELGPGGEEATRSVPEKPEDASEQEGAVDGEHTCSECGMVFQRRYSLIMHTLKHEKSRGFKCGLCNKDFQYAASLRAHMARHRHQKTQRASLPRPVTEDTLEAEEGEEKPKPRTKREFVCDICGKTLPKLYSLRIHMLNHTGVRPHACRVCGKTFAHKHSLKMHRALHDAAKQFHCTICQKSFVSKRSLEEHTSIHTGESKYLCTTCGRSFHRASGLSKHLKRHQPRPEVRAYQCSHCDKSFYEAKDLQQHMNKHLGLKPFQCQVCGKCYSWKKDWYSHVKSHTVAEPYR
ncbi:zinc finger and BTB domain-containing protein 11 [Clupea harengus]|uniref:Zinc finger and BTB domain-containing protein 11 n=1 Tax=Clupea harengus TaxID=7950 RepID=A0A6P8G4H9_CLUHA|nr:zinc finger and BTB domain-containing protein 11 [Clupea harengus]